MSNGQFKTNKYNAETSKSGETAFMNTGMLMQGIGNLVQEGISERISSFFGNIPEHEINPLLRDFIAQARTHMTMDEATVYSAAALSDEQLNQIKSGLLIKFRRPFNVTANIEPELLGGLRIVVGNTIIDNTISRKLNEMKSVIFEMLERDTIESSKVSTPQPTEWPGRVYTDEH